MLGGLEVHPIDNYIKKYKLNILEIKHSTCAKRKFNIEQESIIFEVVTNSTPYEVGSNSRKN